MIIRHRRTQLKLQESECYRQDSELRHQCPKEDIDDKVFNMSSSEDVHEKLFREQKDAGLYENSDFVISALFLTSTCYCGR